MRQKELRLALICYGGVSLAVYMHGVTKEVWHLARASRDFHGSDGAPAGIERVYSELLAHLKTRHELRLRVLPDILTGASAGGINAVFLAEAIHSGRSLEPLTELWLKLADIDRLVDPDARPVWRFAKFWAQPLAWWLMRRPGSVVSESVAPETRQEVARKVSNLVRGRWFKPPFSGPGFSSLLFEALQAMHQTPADAPLLPPRHPIDLMVTATDFRGHLELLRLNSPEVVEETEHRLPIGFTARTPANGGQRLADVLELTLAARATASFPGAFPALRIGEIDDLAERESLEWRDRDRFLQRIMPAHYRREQTGSVSLIDGSVLVNAPFAAAMAALPSRPVQREVDRRFVYIDPRPDRSGSLTDEEREEPIGFFAAIFGSLSTIPREQPIRDNLELLDEQSREAARLQRIVKSLRPEVEKAVDRLFGRTLFLNQPNPKRLRSWRNRAQQSAAEQAGYAYHSYALAKFTGIVERLSRLVLAAAPELGLPDTSSIERALREELNARGVEELSAPGGGANEAAVTFFRAHDIGFRIRRLRLLARRLARDWEADPDIPDSALEAARKAIYEILALYFDREGVDPLGEDFPGAAANVFGDPGRVLDMISERRLLPEVDDQAEEMLAKAFEAMPKNLKRRMLLAYLGFPYYDVATLPLLRSEGYTEFDPVKVDRISPDDARSIREGGTRATLRGIEFYNFGAFFSRAYRENDYLWGRLHGAERMIDLVCSTVEGGMDEQTMHPFKRAAFLAILDEEEARLKANRGLIDRLRQEVDERLPVE
ncbi:patatin-like protein [Qipengyuania atrilutea]|uniref:Patatin-like protein n=1 Tax=Qipengyuania atrilutea TaxID=2744473 RepID=A0A850H3Y8_9SPHN|nr:patatin-like protein [Actirhodobacter atriluteus]NVD43805.1 patatin-like protein [Actirhodobacter atriluteus]